jgi:hypothetical protein
VDLHASKIDRQIECYRSGRPFIFITSKSSLNLHSQRTADGDWAATVSPAERARVSVRRRIRV